MPASPRERAAETASGTSVSTSARSLISTTDRRFSLFLKMIWRARLSPVEIVVPVANDCPHGLRGKKGLKAEYPPTPGGGFAGWKKRATEASSRAGVSGGKTWYAQPEKTTRPNLPPYVSAS